ncbi:MAG: TetR/AcrR family transcriptional regulator [Actinomycetales bacterium]|nr:TetR/AcrR family transcriptional regulator [Actinomycetales bacterium]
MTALATSASPASGRSPLSARGQRTRERLLLAARTVFEERGFDGTRMGDIAEAAGVSHGTVYTWFPTKVDVLHAVAASMTEAMGDSLRTTDDVDAARRIAIANERYFAAYRSCARLLEVVQQAAVVDETFRDILVDLRRSHVERVARAIRRMQAEGIAARDLDAHTSAAALCGMVEGFARHWLGQGEEHDERLALETLDALWIRGLGIASGLSNSTSTPASSKGRTQVRPSRTSGG